MTINADTQQKYEDINALRDALSDFDREDFQLTCGSHFGIEAYKTASKQFDKLHLAYLKSRDASPEELEAAESQIARNRDEVVPFLERMLTEHERIPAIAWVPFVENMRSAHNAVACSTTLAAEMARANFIAEGLDSENILADTNAINSKFGEVISPHLAPFDNIQQAQIA